MLALLKAVQGQRQPAPSTGPASSGPWPPMEPPVARRTAHEEREDPVQGDPLVPHTAPRRTVSETPEPVVPEPAPEPLHPEPAPSPPMPGDPEPSPIIPEEPPTEPVPGPKLETAPRASAASSAPPRATGASKGGQAYEGIQARKEMAKKLAAKKTASKRSAAPRKAAAKVTKKSPEPVEAPPRAWVEPVGGVCPETHPIKAKLSSKLFHLPGMFAYDRCNPDRCYGEEDGAVADGLTKAKR